VFFTYWAEIRANRIEERCFLEAVEFYRGRSAATGVILSDADTLRSRELEAAYQADCISAGGMKNWQDAYDRGRQKKPPLPITAVGSKD
jgi:hypothetical protein